MDAYIENYKRLLIAILYSDSEPKNNQKHQTIVYDTYCNDMPVAVFNSSTTCALFFQTTNKAIDTYVSKKRLIRGRFKIERFK